MRTLVLALLLISCATVAAQDGKPTGPNCNLKTPPPESGEDALHGITLKFFPRAKDISKKYNGCQVMWVPHDGEWHVASIVAIENGYAVRIWNPEKTGTARLCRYKEGKIVRGDPKKRAVPHSLIVKTLPPGCVERALTAE